MILLLSNFKHLLRSFFSHSFDHLGEESSVCTSGVQFRDFVVGILLGQEFEGLIIFSTVAGVHNQNSIGIDDGRESVSNDERSASLKA